MKKRIVRINDGVDFEFNDKEDAVTAIIEEYHANDICIGELLDQIIIEGLSAGDVVDVYARCMNEVEDDEVIHIKDGETHNRWEW